MMAGKLLALLGIDENDRRVAAGRQVAGQLADVVETLVRARHHRKLTQSAVAEEMETTQSAVSNFERIGGDPKFSTILRYAHAIGAKVHFKVSFDGDAPFVSDEPHLMDTVGGAGQERSTFVGFLVSSDQPIEVAR
ncbi:helix-turn-helix transcriptional regulator [Amycolatopsis sp. NPDC006125]|uniref:helix-turn-helix domain-containing protein n=1 Tax=Amycolatopsis sp. NPDC006125 TaxID=3156730 RepID=UPI00339F3D43